MYSHLQESTNAKQTLVSKTNFETFAQRFNVNIKHIHSDNGVYKSKTFMDHCIAADQTQSFSGVGAHWQNGVIERYIGVISTHARTMLLHAMSLWPDHVTSEFWSFAFQHAVRVHNSAPRKGQTLSPHALFTGEDAPQRPTDFRVLFCPVYVLEKELQDNKSKPKWTDRSYQGIYVGHSPHHASNVVLVYNPATKLVSPQYHVIFDEDFTTVSSRFTDEQIENNITNLLGNTLADATSMVSF